MFAPCVACSSALGSMRANTGIILRTSTCKGGVLQRGASAIVTRNCEGLHSLDAARVHSRGVAGCIAGRYRVALTFLERHLAGKPKADHFGPINRKGEAVSSKARPGLLFGFSWLRAYATSPGPAPASANCMYNGEYHHRWCLPGLPGRCDHPTGPKDP